MNNSLFSIAMSLFFVAVACSGPPTAPPNTLDLFINISAGEVTADSLKEDIAKGLDVNESTAEGMSPLAAVLTAQTLTKELRLELVKILLDAGAIPTQTEVQTTHFMTGDAELVKLLNEKVGSLSTEQKSNRNAKQGASDVASAKSTLETGPISGMPWAAGVYMETGMIDGPHSIVSMMLTDGKGISGAHYAFDDDTEWKDWPIEKSGERGVDKFGQIDELAKRTSFRVKISYADGTESPERTYVLTDGSF
jgi:hypothetical protein